MYEKVNRGMSFELETLKSSKEGNMKYTVY